MNNSLEDSFPNSNNTNNITSNNTTTSNNYTFSITIENENGQGFQEFLCTASEYQGLIGKQNDIDLT